jgi:aconitase B
VDDDIRELFEVEKRTSDDLQVVALPTSGTVDQDAHNFLVSQQLAALVSLIGEQTARIDELQSMVIKIDGKTDKIGGTTN